MFGLPRIARMNKFFHFSFYFFIFLSLVACGEKKQTESAASDTPVEIVEELADINQENIKASKKTLLQQMANNLYLEAEKELAAAPRIEMDQAGIYDDIEPVKVEIEVEVPPSLDLDIQAQDEGKP